MSEEYELMKTTEIFLLVYLEQCFVSAVLEIKDGGTLDFFSHFPMRLP